MHGQPHISSTFTSSIRLHLCPNTITHITFYDIKNVYLFAFCPQNGVLPTPFSEQTRASSDKSDDQQSNKTRKSRSHHKEKTLRLHYKTNRLMMFKKIVYFKNRTKHTLNEKMTYSAIFHAGTLVTEWFN